MDGANFAWVQPARAARRAICAALALACGLLAAPAAAQSQNAAGTVEESQARATVVAPLSLVKMDDMIFGLIAARPVVGTVTINPTTNTCSVTGPILRSGTCQSARFAGMATRNMNARISLSQVVNLTGPGQTMTLSNIKLGTNNSFTFIGNVNAQGGGAGLTTGNGNLRYSATSSTGIFVLNLGGTLTVNANQAPGLYRGSVSITVQYQ